MIMENSQANIADKTIFRMAWHSVIALLGALSLMTTLAIAHAGTLDTPEQRAQETQALRLLATPEIQGEIRALEALYEKDPLGNTLGGKATIQRGAESIAMAAIQYAISEDLSRVAFSWNLNAPHKWFGLDVPRSGYGIDNPDNIYRIMGIDGAARYEIHGKVKKPGPMQETIILYGSVPGMGPMTEEGGSILGVLSNETMMIAPDGSFTVTVDGEPANGRPNHIQSRPGETLLTVRDTLSDWMTQNLVSLEVQRVSGPQPQPMTETELATNGAKILAKISAYWLQYFNSFIYSKPANQVAQRFARTGGWGFILNAHFDLADDEALVVTIDPMNAGYVGFQLSDVWGVSLEYRNRNGSLNLAQAKPNTNGTYTYVIAAKDPGVYNWLDSAGLGSGMLAMRWQAVPSSAHAEHAVRDLRVVKLDALKAALPSDTTFVTAAERRSQLAARAKNYERRVAE